MRNAIILSLTLLFLTGACFAQPTIEWQRSLGGSNWDRAYSIQQISDGGFIVAGVSFSNDDDVTWNHGSADYWVVKLNSSGVIEWQRSLGGSEWEEAHSILQTSDGGFIVAGFSYSTDGDATGHHGSSTFSDCWIVKLNSSGTIEWQKSLGGSYYDYAYSIDQTTDGGFIIGGESYSNDGDVTGHHGIAGDYPDYWIVKLDSLGVIEWQKSLGGNYNDYANSIIQTIDTGFIVAGVSYSNDGDVTEHHSTISCSDYWIVKMNSSGVIQWQKSLGGNDDDLAFSVKQTDDDGFIVQGSSYSNDADVTGNHGDYDYWVVKLSSLGILEWQKSLGGSDRDEAYSIRQTSDGGFIIAGSSESNDGDVTENNGSADYWLVKLSSDLWINENILPEQFSINASPNPFNSSVAITVPVGTALEPAKIEIYDLKGNIIVGANSVSPTDEGRIRYAHTNRTFIWTPNKTIASGIYIVKARTEEDNYLTKRIVLIK